MEDKVQKALMNLGWPNVTEILGLKARYYFSVWVVGALLIFLPVEIKERMAITIPEVIRPWVGILTLTTFVFWLVLVFFRAASFVHRLIDERKSRTETLGHFRTLSRGERDIFIQCLSRNENTVFRHINDGSANSLKQKRLLIMAPQGSLLAMPHTIPEFVWDYIKANQVQLFPELSSKEAMLEFDLRQQHSWMR